MKQINSEAKQQKNNKSEKVKGLKIIVSIIPRGKKEIFIDLIEKYKANVQMNFLAHGTATDEIISYLGLDSKEKDILFSVLLEDQVNDCLLEIEDKMKSIKHGKGIAFSIPMESIMGNFNYLLLANIGRSDSFGK